MRKNEKDEISRAQRVAHYNASDTNDKLIFNLRDISHTMRSLYEGKGSQKRILMILNETGIITQRALTERLGIQPGSASEVIAKLESAGLIIRRPCEDDRRTAVIELTADGKEQAVLALEQRHSRHKEMFSCLSDSEKTQLLALLEKINEDWEKRYQEVEDKGRRHHGHGRHREEKAESRHGHGRHMERGE